jgi:hypothetical protein
MHTLSFTKMKSTSQVLYCNLRPPHSVKPLNKSLATHFRGLDAIITFYKGALYVFSSSFRVLFFDKG